MKLRNTTNYDECCKGKRISELDEKVDIQGTEYIPYQEGDDNGKFSLGSLKDYLIKLIEEYLINNGIIREDWVQSEPAYKLLATLPELIADRACKDEFGNNINDTYLTREAVKEYISSIYEDLFVNNPPQILDGFITVDMLSDAVLQLLNSGGAITNFPDDEDITVKDGKLKFKDKVYDPNNYSGFGRKYLRKNMVNGVNVLTQEMISEPNQIYIIQYDYDLRGDSITIPNNCVLNFRGGSLSNGNINLNDCTFTGSNIQVNCDITGTLQNDNVFVEWFQLHQDGITDDSKKLYNIFNAIKSNTNLYFPTNKSYLHGDGLETEKGTGNSYTPDPNNNTRPLIDSSHPVDIGRDIRLMIVNKSNINIYGNDCVIIANPNNGECRNNAILWIENSSNINIYDLTLNGNKDNRKPVFSDYNTGKGEADRHNIVVFSSHNVTFNNVSSNNSIHNGFSILKNYEKDSELPYNIKFINCSVDNPYKNGIGINSGYNYTIEGGEYSNAGGNYSISPKAAIDIETEVTSTLNTKVIIKNIYVHDCPTAGIITSGTTSLVDISNCQFTQSPLIIGGSSNYISVHDSSFYNSPISCAYSKIYNNMIDFDSTINVVPNTYLIIASNSFIYNNNINGNNASVGNRRLMLNNNNYLYNNYFHNITTVNANLISNSYSYNNVFENMTVNNSSTGENIYKNCVHQNINNISTSGNATYNLYSSIIRPNSCRYFKFTGLNRYDEVGIITSTYKIIFNKNQRAEVPSSNMKIYRNSSTLDLIICLEDENYTIPASLIVFVKRSSQGVNSFSNKFYESSNIEVLETADTSGYTLINSALTTKRNFISWANIGELQIDNTSNIPYFWNGSEWVILTEIVLT